MEGPQFEQLGERGEGRVISRFWKARELRYLKEMNDGTECAKQGSSLLACTEIEMFERSALKLPLQLSSCTPPPVTCMEVIAVATWMTPDVQLSFANRRRSSVLFVGWILIRMDIGVSHSRPEGGSGESGSSIMRAVSTTRDGEDLLRDVTMI